MKKTIKVLGVLGLLVVGFFTISMFSVEKTEAASLNSNAIITNDHGVVINDSVISLDDEEFYWTNSFTIGSNSPVIGRNIVVNLSGKNYGLPSAIYYTKYQPGFAIPFQGYLKLSSIHGEGNIPYGVYVGQALSYFI